MESVASVNDLQAKEALNRANHYLATNTFDLAIVEFEKAYRFSPSLGAESYARALLQRAERKTQSGDHAGAASDANLAQQVFPSIAPNPSAPDIPPVPMTPPKKATGWTFWLAWTGTTAVGYLIYKIFDEFLKWDIVLYILRRNLISLNSPLWVALHACFYAILGALIGLGQYILLRKKTENAWVGACSGIKHLHLCHA